MSRVSIETAMTGAGVTSSVPRPRRRRLLPLIGSLSLFGPFCIDMYLPAFPTLTRDLHASASEIQFSLTACLIGLGAGQLLVGPICDRTGRRPPLLVGLTLFVASSVLCAFAVSAPMLIAVRFFQGLGGSAGIVVARAMVRDLFEGVAAARFFAMLMLVTGAGPILAPQVGAGLLDLTSWRGVFVALAVAGGALTVLALTRIPETLPVELRNGGGLGDTLRTIRRVASSRAFLGYGLTAGLGFGGIFAYIAGSPFLMENIYRLSPQQYSLVFALNGVGLIMGSQISARLVTRVGSERLLTVGLVSMASIGSLFLIMVWDGGFGLAAVLPVLFGLVASIGLVSPNAMALALNSFPEAAGSASALVGAAQFGIGAAVAPLVGIGGSHDALPMGVAMAALGMTALSVRLTMLLTRPRFAPA